MSWCLPGDSRLNRGFSRTMRIARIEYRLNRGLSRMTQMTRIEETVPLTAFFS